MNQAELELNREIERVHEALDAAGIPRLDDQEGNRMLTLFARTVMLWEDRDRYLNRLRRLECERVELRKSGEG